MKYEKNYRQLTVNCVLLKLIYVVQRQEAQITFRFYTDGNKATVIG
jgi:hypothetical protein